MILGKQTWNKQLIIYKTPLLATFVYNVFQLPSSSVGMGQWPTIEGWMNGRVSKKMLHNSLHFILEQWIWTDVLYLSQYSVPRHRMSVHICMHTSHIKDTIFKAWALSWARWPTGEVLISFNPQTWSCLCSSVSLYQASSHGSGRWWRLPDSGGHAVWQRLNDHSAAALTPQLTP